MLYLRLSMDLEENIKRKSHAGQSWHKPLISVLGRQWQVDFYEFWASLIYRVYSRITRATHRKTLSETNK